MASPLESAYKNPQAAAPAGVNYAAPDLRRHPPRSPYTRLGGFVHLPRLIDKARAVVAGTNGDYHYNCPFDQRLFAFTGIDQEKFLAEVKQGKTDSELLAYVMEHSSPQRHPAEIEAWSRWFEQLAPTTPEIRTFFNDVHAKNAPHRADIATWLDWVELDDFVTFGGKP